MAKLARVAIIMALGFAAAAHAQTSAWSDIDCAQSDIVLPSRIPAPGAKCRLQSSFAGSEGRGDFHSQTAVYRSKEEAIFVFLKKPRITFQDSSVLVSVDAREKFLSQPVKTTSNTSGFSDTIKLAGGYAKTFKFAPEWQCFSFWKDGPLHGRGVAYVLAGYRCGKTAEAQSKNVMTAFLTELTVK